VATGHNLVVEASAERRGGKSLCNDSTEHARGLNEGPGAYGGRKKEEKVLGGREMHREIQGGKAKQPYC